MKVPSRLAKQAKMLLLLGLIAQIYSLGYSNQEVVHTTATICKAKTLLDGNILVLSDIKTKADTKMSVLDRDGRLVYGDTILSNIHFGPTAELTQSQITKNYFFSFHENQSKSGASQREYTLTFGEKGQNINKKERKDTLDQKTSIFALKNGNIFIASVNKLVSGSGESSVSVYINDPSSNENFAGGESFSTPSKYVSCFEQRENLVYCAYVSYENVFVSKMKLRSYNVNGKTITFGKEQVIKTFYTDFNFIKAVPVNDNEAAILFQTGKNTNIPKYGNTGRDLYYYLIETTSSGLFVKRYDYLYNNCLYRGDPEHVNADIAVLSPTKTYVACEMGDDKFHGMLITPDSKEVVEFNFNNFGASYVSYPLFALFGQSMGLFYTLDQDQIVYQIMNYPDCKNYEKNILVPVHYMKEFDLKGYVYILNAYPASRVDEVMYFRLKIPEHLNFTNAGTQEAILDDTNYDVTQTTLKVVAEEALGLNNVGFTSAYVDARDGLIVGKTCNLNIYTPKCLSQCYSCSREGDTAHHYCLGCKERHFAEEDPAAENEGFGRPEYCHRCNVACYSCFGNATNYTTNCKKCDYENGYYPFELDERLCLSNITKIDVEIRLKRGLWLHKVVIGDIYTWVWRLCHKNCATCNEKGDDNNNKCTKCIADYHFYYNMTEVNNTIPGSCVPDCDGNGFYVNETDDKCYPCFGHCKVCHNYNICENCYPNWFNLPDRTACVDTCPTPLAYDRDFWECVCCKTRYNHTEQSPRYNLNQTCVYPMPEGYHIIEETCNTIWLCGHKGCSLCDWNSTQCTKCFPWYYKQHFKGEQPSIIGCYEYRECGLLGGAPINRSEEGLCLNCKIENGTYRYPDPSNGHDEGKSENWVCIDQKKNMTFVDIPEYNRLYWCYLRCASCDDYGIPDKMNCKTCRTPSRYKIFNAYTPARYTSEEIRNAIGDCIQNPPKCQGCSYYHKYNEEDIDGVDICMCDKVNDVCTICHDCPENFPYYMIETRECVETCGFTQLLSGVCSMSNTLAAIEFLKNPFYMKDTKTSINATEMIASIVSTAFAQNYFQQNNININDVTNTINTVFGSGQIYNLPQSQIIIGNNVSIEFTTLKLELQKLAEIVAKGFSNSTQTQSIVQMESCEQILKQQYGISDQEDLMIIKGDLMKQLSEYYASQVEYQVFSTSLGQFLDLCPCKQANATVSITNPFNVSFFTGTYQAKVSSVADNGYDPFDSSSSFYNDICTPFTNENGNDVLLEDRKADYYNTKVGVCESGCSYDGYNSTTKMFTCKCQIKDSVTENTKTVEFDPSTVPDDFYKTQKNSNIEVIKCSSQVFSTKGQSKNFGSYTLLVGMASLIATFVVHMLKGTRVFNQALQKLTFEVKANPPREPKEPTKTDDFGYKDGIKEKEKIQVNKDREYYDVEINMFKFEEAKKCARPWYKWYWSYLQNKQIIIFTFFTQKDYQVRTVKIALFTLFVAFYFFFTALFFNDDIMRQIYKYKGKAGAAIYIPSIILSSFCCLIMSLLVRFVVLSERDISKVHQISDKVARDNKVSEITSLLKIKTFILFGVTFLLYGFCWYYVSAFCAVFKNSQGRYFLTVFSAFLVCNLCPFALCLIPAFLRAKSLSSDNQCLYRASQIISYI